MGEELQEEKRHMKFTVVHWKQCLSGAWKKKRSIELPHGRSHIHMKTDSSFSYGFQTKSVTGKGERERTEVNDNIGTASGDTATGAWD